MKYNFDEIVSRKGTACVKWDAPNAAGVPSDEVLPMWVADMDFRTAPCIIDALRARVDHGVFGYTEVPDSYYRCVIEWFGRRRGWKIEREWIQYTTAVVPALSVVIKALTQEGDEVVFLSPAYNCFFSSIRNSGCIASASPLIYHYAPACVEGTVPGGHFRSGDASGSEARTRFCPPGAVPSTQARTITVDIDWEDLERRCAQERAKVLLLCNPHNPVGRIWTREELARLGEIAGRCGVAVISDEIHCELEMPGYRFTPFAAVSAQNQHLCVTLNSPSKSFNTAGLQIANIICDNPDWRKRIDRVINTYEVCDVNPFGVVGLHAAYREGEDWLEELNACLWENYRLLKGTFERELPQFPVAELQGTYLVWVDISALGMGSQEVVDELIRLGKVRLGPGIIYGDDRFVRVNIACPRVLMEEGLQRMVGALKKLAYKA